MTNLSLALSNIYERMRNFKPIKPFYHILSRMGLFTLCYFLFNNFWFRKNPTQKMKNEKNFFLEHAQELRMVYDYLEDDRSKLVFENLLEYRVTSNWTCFKRSLDKDSLRTQYFVPELLFSNHEIIVDCGAFNGDTVKRFYKNIPSCRVIALEPDEKNFELLQKLKLEDLKCIKAGAWSENTTLRFSDKGGGTTTGAVDASGNTQIEVKALDYLPECQPATFIKMDIEGAEMEALKGAKKIISEGKPKLAICIYHQPQDLFEIPLYVKKLNPDYKLFIHHHLPWGLSETVLYAV